MNQPTTKRLDDKDILAIAHQLELTDFITTGSFDAVEMNYPYVKFTQCSEDDLAELESYQSFQGFDLHLVSSGGAGCSFITRELGQCTGILIALHED
ncbi:hypothetical protein [Vibrio sp. MA40-2]|uniref:hypothetical protein n=1 Tax=Vibrio sp. MA40-2 TaxID=3391828 RepID=UPI0039A4512B